MKYRITKKEHMENLRKTISAVRAGAREICKSPAAGELGSITIGVGKPAGIDVWAFDQYGKVVVECGRAGVALDILNKEIWKYFPILARESEYNETYLMETEEMKDDSEDGFYKTVFTIRFSKSGKSFKIECDPELRKFCRKLILPYLISPLGTPAWEIVRNIAKGTGWSIAETRREVCKRIRLDEETFEMWILGWRNPGETFEKRLYFSQFARETMVKIPKEEEKLIKAAQFVGLKVTETGE